MSRDLHFDSQANAESFLLDGNIARFKESTRVTRSRAKQLTILEQRRDALRAPVYKLPDEVLAEIFKAGAMEMTEGMNVPDITFSLKVSWVVSRWRRVALHTPALWTLLRLTLPPEDASEYEEWTTFWARTCASSCPLTVCVELSPSEPGSSFDYKPLELPNVLSRSQILLLEGGERRYYPHHLMTPSHTIITPFRSLVYFHLSCVRFPTFLSFIDLLRLLPSLVILRLEGVRIDDPSPTETCIVQLERLERLAMYSIELGSNWNTHTPLRCFKMPHLRRILVDCWDGVVTSDMDFSTVTWLALQGPRTVRQRDIIELICRMPLLAQLNIDVFLEEPDSDYFPTHLSVPPLVHIDFSFSTRVDSLARWLVERTGTGQTTRKSLKSVSLRRYLEPTLSPLSASIQQWIRERDIEVILVPTSEPVDWEEL